MHWLPLVGERESGQVPRPLATCPQGQRGPGHSACMAGLWGDTVSASELQGGLWCQPPAHVGAPSNVRCVSSA